MGVTAAALAAGRCATSNLPLRPFSDLLCRLQSSWRSYHPKRKKCFVSFNVRLHMLLAFPGSAELGPAQTCCEHVPVPASALLHAWFRALDQPWISAVPRPDCARVDPANVRCQEHDLCCRSSSRSLPHSCLYVPRPHVYQGG